MRLRDQALFVESFQALLNNIRLLYNKAWKPDTRKGRVNRITKKTEKLNLQESKQSHVETNGHALKLEIKTIFFLSLE